VFLVVIELAAALDTRRVAVIVFVVQEFGDAADQQGGQGYQGTTACHTLDENAQASSRVGHNIEQFHLPLRFLRRHELATDLL
jgi:hypothetical protein